MHPSPVPALEPCRNDLASVFFPRFFTSFPAKTSAYAGDHCKAAFLYPSLFPFLLSIDPVPHRRPFAVITTCLCCYAQFSLGLSVLLLFCKVPNVFSSNFFTLPSSLMSPPNPFRPEFLLFCTTYKRPYESFGQGVSLPSAYFFPTFCPILAKPQWCFLYSSSMCEFCYLLPIALPFSFFSIQTPTSVWRIYQ